MARPRVIIADTDEIYLIPLQLKFIETYFDEIDLEIITEREYFINLFSTPQTVDVLVVSDELYDFTLQRHNIEHVFVVSEEFANRTANLNLTEVYKYASLKEIFAIIVSKSAGVLNRTKAREKQTEIITFYSACGGTGKTTLAVGMAGALTKFNKRVLYINAARLQFFQHWLENKTGIISMEQYAKLAGLPDDSYYVVKDIIRKEEFNYLPPFKSSLMSVGLDYSIYKKIIQSAKQSNDFDYIIVDADVAFDENKAALLSISDKVLIITNQNKTTVEATNILMANINGVDMEKYIFICNEFEQEKEALGALKENLPNYSVSLYIEHFDNVDIMSAKELVLKDSIQKTAFLVM